MMFKKKDKNTDIENAVEPWYEYRIKHEWDILTAKHIYNIYQYRVLHVGMYIGITGGWVEVGSGNKSWATKNSIALNTPMPQGKP